MTSSPAIPLSSQVGGHSGVLTTEDGSLLIKPALPLELKFYQSQLADSRYAPLRPFIPKFYGTLKLEGKLDESQPNEQGITLVPVDAQIKEAKDESSLVLENLSHPFIKPNILDIKLGTVLYDETASPEKVARMEKTARDTTSFETGVRLTGFQTYDNITSQPVNTPKSYGKSIKASDLPDGIARFFPIGCSVSDIPTDLATSASTSGLSRSTLLPILRAIREDVAEIRDALAEIHMRMVGGSLLIVYEADWARADEGVKALGLVGGGKGAAGEEGEDDEEEEEEEEDDDSEDDETKRPGPPYAVKLIDFAHTRITPGKGPDEGVLLGLDTVLKLLDGRIKEVDASGA